MCLPALRALKKSSPNDRIYVAVKLHLCCIFQNIHEIDEIIPLPDNNDPKSLLSAAKHLRKYCFHYGILFTNSFQSALLFKLSGVKKIIGYQKDLRGWLLDKKIKFPQNDMHHIHFYLDIIANFIQEKSGKKIETSESSPLYINPEEAEKVSDQLINLGVNLSRPLVAISSSAAYGTAKEWLPERFRELLLRLLQENLLINPEILLLGSLKEREKIVKIIDDQEGIHNLAGKLSLRETLVAISLCRLFIGNDSGLMHVASSFDLPLVALFGPTRPDKTGPLNKNARVLYHPVACAPCLYRDCPLKNDNHACMKAITVDEVIKTLRLLKI